MHSPCLYAFNDQCNINGQKYSFNQGHLKGLSSEKLSRNLIYTLRVMSDLARNSFLFHSSYRVYIMSVKRDHYDNILCYYDTIMYVVHL